MTKTLIANTLVTRTGFIEPVMLMAGDEVPDWADGLVGDHLIAGPGPEPEKPKRAPARSAKAADKSDD